MRLSKRGEYALRALIDLGIAQKLGNPMLQSSALARSERIPVKFLEQILAQLRRAGYLGSVRGKHGGYFLRKPLKKIRAGDIVRLTDGALAPIACVSQTAYKKCSCPDEKHCGLRILMLDVRAALSGVLDRYTLEDVVGVTLKTILRDGVKMPFLELKDAGS